MRHEHVFLSLALSYLRDLSEISRGRGWKQGEGHNFLRLRKGRGHEKWAVKRGRVMQISARDHVEVHPQKKKEKGTIQGVPKVRSSNLMHSNFWSKVYFYMKFLEHVYFSTEYMHPEFPLLAWAFWFFITFCSRCGMKWDTVCRPTDDPFWAFLSPGAQEPVHPHTILVYFRQLKKYIYI